MEKEPKVVYVVSLTSTFGIINKYGCSLGLASAKESTLENYKFRCNLKFSFAREYFAFILSFIAVSKTLEALVQ